MSDTPESDPTTYSLTAERVSPKRTSVDTGDTELVVGMDANPVEYFLASVLACVNSTGTVVARDMGIDIDGLTATVTGDVDYARYHGDESDNRAGLQGLDITVEVDSDASEATLEEWLGAVERRCPISDNVANETPVALDIEAA